MAKERTSLSLDPDVAAYLQQESVNASGLVNQLVKRHMNGGEDGDAIREFRIRQLEDEAEELASREQRKREQVEKLRELKQEEQNERESEMKDAIDKLENVVRNPDNPAIQTQARNLGMTPEELIEELPPLDDDSGGFNSL